jgi:hypothetical protein
VVGDVDIRGAVEAWPAEVNVGYPPTVSADDEVGVAVVVQITGVRY